MGRWLKTHGGDANADARDSRGAKRQEFLIMHMVMAMRDKKARSTKTTTRVVAAENDVSSFVWWGAEKMAAELGSEKGKSFGEPGALGLSLWDEAWALERQLARYPLAFL